MKQTGLKGNVNIRMGDDNVRMNGIIIVEISCNVTDYENM